MADYYVDSNNGSPSSPYGSWGAAAQTLQAVLSLVGTGGDNIYIAHNHSETETTNGDFNFGGSVTTPTKVICRNSSTNALTTGAFVNFVNGATLMRFQGFFYAYGITFKCGDDIGNGNNIGFLLSVGNHHTFDTCTLNVSDTGARSFTLLTDGGWVRFIKCTLTAGAAGTNIAFQQESMALFEDCTISHAGTTQVFSMGGETDVVIRGLDISNWDSSAALFSSEDSDHPRHTNFGIKFPASYTGNVLGSASVGHFLPLAVSGWDDSDASAIGAQNAYGTLRHETTLVRNGGSATSWRIDLTSSSSPLRWFETPPIAIWNTTTGSAVTVKVHFLHDSLTDLQNDEIWLNVFYLNESGSNHYALSTSKMALLGTPSDLTNNSETWSTTGMTNPNKQEVSVSVTPQKAGYIMVYVCGGTGAAKTLYVCPKVELS